MRQAQALIAFTLLFIITSCQDLDQIGERVTDGVTFEVSTNLLANPLILQFGDPRTGEIPENISVNIASSEFSGVYTLDGRLDLSFSEGILPLAVLKDEIQLGGEPKRIVIDIEAPGFLSQERVFVVNDLEPRVVQITFEPGRDQNPDGDELVGSFLLNSSTNRILESNRGLLKINIPPQTRFLDQYGNPLVGQDQLISSIFNNTSENRPYLRNQLTEQNYELYNGALSSVTIEPIAMMTLSLAKKPDASDLLYPITIRVPITPGTKNRFTGQLLKAGDQIPIYGFLEQEKHWRSVGFAKINEGANGLEATAWVKKLQTLVFGWASFIEPDIDMECVVLVDIYADVPTPYSGMYLSEYLDTLQTPSGKDTVVTIKEEVVFNYEQQPRISFSGVFPNCSSGNTDDLDAIIRQAKTDAQVYFLRQDSLAFEGITFKTKATVYPLSRSVECQNQNNTAVLTPKYVDLYIRSDAMGDGFLSFSYGNIQGREYVRLQEGQNHVMLPYPESLFLLDGEKAIFDFTFLENCYRLTDGTETSVCALLEGFSFDISPPFQREPMRLSLKAETACNNINSNKVIIRPTMPILFRPHCAQAPSPYRYLGQLTDGRFEGNVPLVEGQSYDFLLPLGTSVTKLENISLSTVEAIYQRGNNTITVLKTDNGHQLDLGIVEVPDAICRLLN